MKLLLISIATHLGFEFLNFILKFETGIFLSILIKKPLECLSQEVFGLLFKIYSNVFSRNFRLLIN